MRKSVAAWMPGSGGNQTGCPASSAIIGPACFWSFLDFGLRNSSPGDLPPPRCSTLTNGGARSRRERNRRTSFALMFSRMRFWIVTRRGMRAIRNVKSPLRVPRTGRSVRTVTRSPPRKRLRSTKLAPLPSECARSRPAWRPLREPLTRIVPSRLARAPRSEICVRGPAETVPGEGYALIAPGPSL